MMHRQNASRAAVQEWFVARFGPGVRIGEGVFIDPYDRGGAANSLRPSEHHEYRARSFSELRSGRVSAFSVAHSKMRGFHEALAKRRPASALGQKCGMDRDENIAVTLKGDVLTCQNVSPVSRAMNGESHKIGTVDKLNEVRLTTSTHWSHRDECKNCPVLHLCGGACMFLEGRLFEMGCDNSFSDNIAFFAGTIEHLTGMIPVHIEGPQRPERQWIWGRPG
jgi:uncharacterized protein